MLARFYGRRASLFACLLSLALPAACANAADADVADADVADADADLASFESAGAHQFHGSNPHFTIEYPWSWNDDDDLSAPLVLQATAPTQLPVLRVAVLDEPFWLPLAFATRAASTQLSGLGREIEVLSEEVVDTPDGGRANVGEVSWTASVGAGVAVRSLYVHRFHEGRWVVVNLTTADAGDPVSDDLREIALSVRFPSGEASDSP